MLDVIKNPLMAERRAGLLLHPTSLPGPGPVGQLGADAHRFIDWLAAAGFGVWQFLPLHPPQLDGSPYAAISAFAGDTRLIDIPTLVAAGWLDARDEHRSSADALVAARLKLQASNGPVWKAFKRFCAEQRSWLDDFALFAVVRAQQGTKPWWQWPTDLRQRDPQRISLLRARAHEAIEAERFAQFVFFQQWQQLKAYANQRGVLLLGDLPIFVAHDSVDVWAHPELFDLDEQGAPRTVAGVPPDYFSATGQRWGNPHYRWQDMAANGFSWWLSRIGWALANLDGLRIDHFRGFEAYWSVPAHEPTAMVGEWVPGPRDAFFQAVLDHFGELPLIAEDLGVITPEVNALRERFKLPGMKILQFAFDSGPDNPYLPANHVEMGVVYTGTHDNDTSLGWFRHLEPQAQAEVLRVLGDPHDPMPWPLIHAALASPARLAVIPMQDALALDDRHRMNTPGTVVGNWQWRFHWEQILAGLAQHLLALNQAWQRV